MADDMLRPTLREYLEQRLDYERTLVSQMFAALERRIEAQEKAHSRALELQAAEYERRLNALNHAHEAAVKEQARVLPRELHDAFVKEYDLFRLDVSKQLAAITTRSVTWTAAIGAFFLIASILVRFWVR